MAKPLLITELEALKNLVDETLPPSDWFEITQQRIDRFAEATGDMQWIHTDPERAKRESPYGTTIAHGYMTMSLMPMLLEQIIEVPVRMMVNPGVEKMRLRAPVRCGDRIRMHAKIKALRSLSSGGVRATLGISFEIQGESKPAAFGDVHLVYYW